MSIYKSKASSALWLTQNKFTQSLNLPAAAVFSFTAADVTQIQLHFLKQEPGSHHKGSRNALECHISFKSNTTK